MRSLRRLSALGVLSILMPFLGCDLDDVVLEHLLNLEDSRLPSAEIISLQASTRRAVVSAAENNSAVILNLADAALPVIEHVVDLGTATGEHLTSVAFHPEEDYFAAAIQAADPWAPGRVELRSATTGALLKVLPVGIGPDSVVFDARGRRAVVANEAEIYVRNPDGSFSSPPGSISILRLAQGPEAATSVTLALEDQTGAPGFLSADDKRQIERVVDGGTVLIPLTHLTPDHLEPEGIAISPSGRRAYVTLQEANGVVVIDLLREEVDTYIGLGKTTHLADLKNDGIASFVNELVALRESDGIALLHGGAFFVTADEGDTDPRIDRRAPGAPAGGGRTLSVFNAHTGHFVADTGSQIDEAANAAGIYPESRSRNKGSEPEVVIAFQAWGHTVGLVGLERANGIALVSLTNPHLPWVVRVAGGGPSGQGPEGLAHLEDDATGHHYIYTANEVSGTIGVYRLRKP